MKAVRLALVTAPLAVAVLIAVVLVLAGGNGSLVLRMPLATVIVVSGALASVVLILVLVVRPMTARRRDAAIVAARAEGAVAERDAHRRFLRRLDHELKNPVTAIRSALAAGEQTPPENLVIASAQATRLSGVVTQLRALSSLETRPIEASRVDLAVIVEEEAAALRDELAARGARRSVETVLPTVPWPLPPVTGDPDLLAVAVRNLLLNAAKYSGEGARIEVRGTEETDTVVIEVADTGWGIRAEDLPFVWEELWRAQDARGVEGTGLGLSLVRVVVHRHGGEVSLRSQFGRGTSVRLTLPRAPR
ncbi:sensor histidine kinase [Microbacterium sp. Clip185]|uniref:sensor histidine kinase n=1 Tax=Microbacterium sp. Clip185 TaxID=3025663 RepID=UPI00236694E0|nr:HAMP domain-containing sensor histidine kinase [Microbacterium sp. Clip185]WDG18625.1 HAMP domain-containing sensor histidine kinase [Microbacterium sp. Clip185]